MRETELTPLGLLVLTTACHVVVDQDQQLPRLWHQAVETLPQRFASQSIGDFNVLEGRFDAGRAAGVSLTRSLVLVQKCDRSDQRQILGVIPSASASGLHET